MKLTVTEDGVRAELVLDQPVVTIGRALDNDIRLESKLVSRHHSRLEQREGEAWVLDLGSANGTLVNGEKVTRRILAAGDRVEIGGVKIVLDATRDEPAVAGRSVPHSLNADLTEALNTEADATGLRTLTGEARRERENLRVFAKITRALTREVELLPLLRSIVDSAISLVGGERGFVLLHDGRREEESRPAGEARAAVDVSKMSVSVARSFDQTDIVVPRTRLSLGIARKVVDEGKGLLSLDASEDDRFDGMASVEDLRLRSVMCLPIRSGGRTEGVLYIDNRLQYGAFGEHDLELMELFAGQASIAVNNARLVAELRERNARLEASRRQIEALNGELGRKVRDQGSELAVVRRALDRERGRYDYGNLVGASDSMHRIFQQLDRIVESDLPVLIHGESGTGKELIARAIHYNGPRKARPFVTENCAALPDTLLESELFGHVRGAFTGAYKNKKGLLEQADGGTLFLDEIGDMSAAMQTKLLRVLQEGEFRVLGSDRIVKVDVRVLAASHRDLEEMVRDGTFREDLYYRIAVLSVQLPPLRERRDDIPLLAEHLLARAARDAARNLPVLPHEVMAALVAHDWPGNVRELENEMRRIIVLAKDEVRLEHLSEVVQEGRTKEGAVKGTAVVLEQGDIRGAVADLERRSIEAALAQAGNNKSRAADALGISRFALQRKLLRYGLLERREVADDGP
ncbi:MAG: sigma 54-interacting transcriptional regulator [Planctomycetota bacterium]